MPSHVKLLKPKRRVNREFNSYIAPRATDIELVEGDKQRASGHKSAAMVHVYDRKLARVKPAGDE